VTAKQDSEDVNAGYAGAARQGGLRFVSIVTGFHQRAGSESIKVLKSKFQGSEASKTHRQVCQWVLYLWWPVKITESALVAMQALRSAFSDPLVEQRSWVLCPLAARADVTYVGVNGSLAASATFSLSGITLTVTLTNTSTSDVLVPTDVLTSAWFDSAKTLTPVSVSLGTCVLRNNHQCC
jgi:hypothetical protein